MKNWRKIKLVICSFSLASLCFGQTGIVWQTEQVVADGSTYGNVRPRLAISDNNIPQVLMGNSNGSVLFVATGNGTGFNTPNQISPVGMPTYLANWTGPDIAAEGDNVVVVFKAEPYEDGNIYAVRSTNGGASFGDTIRVDDYNIGTTWMPALDMDENGNPVVTYMTFDSFGGDERIAIVRSNDGGATYLPQQTVSSSAPGVACDCCPPEVIVEGNYQLSLFRNNESNIRDVWGSLSIDNGSNFNSQVNIDNLGWYITSCPTTGPHGVIIGDSAYVIAASRATGDYRVYVSTVDLATGLNVNSTQMMDPPMGSVSDAQNYPRISGGGDTIIAVWEERVSNNPDVYYSISTNGLANTLTTNKYLLNQNTVGTQGKPDIVYKNGIVHVVYQDLSSGNVMYKKGTIGDIAELSEIEVSSVSVYPNPSNGTFQVNGIDLDKINSISVNDLSGKKVDYLLENNVIVLQKAWAGIYFLQIELNSGEILSTKLIVE